VIEGDKPDEAYVCAELEALLQWGARRREDYQNFYIKISGNQLSIDMEDARVLVIGSDGSLVLREAKFGCR